MCKYCDGGYTSPSFIETNDVELYLDGNDGSIEVYLKNFGEFGRETDYTFYVGDVNFCPVCGRDLSAKYDEVYVVMTELNDFKNLAPWPCVYRDKNDAATRVEELKSRGQWDTVWCAPTELVQSSQFTFQDDKNKT